MIAEPTEERAKIKWAELAGPRTIYTHGPECLEPGPASPHLLGPMFATTSEAAEDARRWAALHRAHRVVYKLVPISYHRALTGRVDG